MNKFHYNKFGIIQIGVKALSQSKSQIHPNSSLLQIQNQKFKYEPKNQRFTNTKYEYQIRIAHKPKREPQIKSKSFNAPRENKSPNHRTKTKRHKPLSLFQIAIHKYHRTKQQKASFSNTHKTLNLPQYTLFILDIQVGKDASPSSNRICNAISLSPRSPY